MARSDIAPLKAWLVKDIAEELEPSWRIAFYREVLALVEVAEAAKDYFDVDPTEIHEIHKVEGRLDAALAKFSFGDGGKEFMNQAHGGFQKHEVPGIPKEAAYNLFEVLASKGYAVAMKHRQGTYQIEVPVRLSGDPAYEKEVEIMEIAFRAGYNPIQTGGSIRIVG